MQRNQDPITKVTLGRKTKKSPQDGKGSDLCFYLNGEEAPKLLLKRLNRKGLPAKYGFEVNTPGYPFALIVEDPADPAKGQLASRQILTKPIEKGLLDIVITEQFPSNFIYGCVNQPYMGAPVIIEQDKKEMKIVDLKLPETLIRGTAIRATEEGIFIAVITGQIYRFHKRRLETYIDFYATIKSKTVKLHDFVILPPADGKIRRTILLISNLQKLPQYALVEIIGDETPKLMFRIDESAGPAHLVLWGTTLFITTERNIYRIDVEKPGLYNVYQDNLDDCDGTLYLRNKQALTTMLVVDETLLFFGKEIWNDKKRLRKFENPIRVAHQVKSGPFFAIDERRHLYYFTYEDGEILPGWSVNVSSEVLDITSYEDHLYLLILDDQERVSIRELENWQSAAIGI